MSHRIENVQQTSSDCQQTAKRQPKDSQQKQTHIGMLPKKDYIMAIIPLCPMVLGVESAGGCQN